MRYEYAATRYENISSAYQKAYGTGKMQSVRTVQLKVKSCPFYNDIKVSDKSILISEGEMDQKAVDRHDHHGYSNIQYIAVQKFFSCKEVRSTNLHSNGWASPDD